jgi:hypothetical protein
MPASPSDRGEVYLKVIEHTIRNTQDTVRTSQQTHYVSATEQSFLGPSSAELMTVFCCLKFETPATWRARFPYFPQEEGGPFIPPSIALVLCETHKYSSYLGGNTRPGD